ncbi:hypothetical protein [Cellulomonas edaphi]|uniref:Uncharacterized protein n=1 Tax=Cellulomonas edaphi TaxID=3053468 RepID=A0ABT7S547_9CELL|nr:hypothetical protein [Cellulomons edaphi]MDM7830746.1 hypothetical protein [Cellulomons edaphi]
MLFAVTPSPYPSPSGVAVTTSQGGSPGFLGFVFTFLLALAAVLLFLSLTKHLRVVDRRAKQQGLDDDPDASPVAQEEADPRGDRRPDDEPPAGR